MTQDLKSALKAMVEIVQLIAETIKTRKEIPAGELYALLMPSGCTLEQYEKIEGILIESGKVEKKGNLLKWKQK